MNQTVRFPCALAASCAPTAARRRRQPTIRLLYALFVAVLAATLYVPIAQASVETEEPDRPHERTAVTVAPSGASHEMNAPRTVAADSTNNRSPENNLSPADWPTGLLPAIAEQWGRQAPWRPQPTRSGAQASNDRHGLTASFDTQGLRLSSVAGEIHLSLAGVGRDGELQAPGAAEAELDGARVVYRHDANLTQWFINSPLGLEQGFTLERRPEGQGELRFALALGGDLTAQLDQNELVFVDEGGAAQLRYGALVAYDAQGQALPARMHLAGERLVLAVDDAGAAYPVVVDPLFSQLRKLTTENHAENDQFGASIALSGDGDTALIGAPFRNTGSGAAYVFIRNGASWSPQTKLTAADGAVLDRFGTRVSLSADGGTALVGASSAKVDGQNAAGAAYVFTRNGASWSQVKLTADDAAAAKLFGSSVALNSDGTAALVGASGSWNGTDYLYGAAYAFIRDGENWSQNQQTKLTPSDSAPGDLFGRSVALSENGATALIGAVAANVGGESEAGAAYIFTPDGANWSQQAKLTAADGLSGDRFGHSAALSGDGATALVGANSAKVGSQSSAGAAYVFTRNGATWSQQAKLTAADGVANDQFGYSVALSSDGAAALIGARYADPGSQSRAGGAYTFTRDGAVWSQRAKLTASDAAMNNEFGYSVALSGHTALIGAPSANLDGVNKAGAAYVFVLEAVDLQLVKNAAPEAPQDSDFVYSFHVTNLDLEVDATGVTLTDTLPPEVSYVSDDGDCTRSGATVTCALGPLAKDGGRTSVRVTVRGLGAHGATITNTASVNADQPDIDPADNTDSVTTTISNTPPVANDSVLLTNEGAVVLGMLLATDTDGDALAFSIVANGAKGAAVITDAATGAFTYTPNAEATGTDTFTFKANDGALDSNIATVTVTIQPLPAPGNVAPVASNLSLIAYEGAVINGTLSAADANGDPLAFSIVDNGAKGVAVITDAATGAFTYTPTAGATGTDTFTFKASDGTLDSNIATVTVTIQPLPAPGNVAPVASNLSLIAHEGGVTSGTLPAADANGDPLIFSVVANGTKGAAVITNTATGAFAYTPNPGETGADTFTFKANDGALDSNIATVTVTIQPLPAPGNVAPIASDLSLLAYEGGIINGTLPASDANGDALTFSIVDNGTKGAAVITNTATGAFIYTPNPGETGTDTFTFKANDGALDSNIAKVTVTIQPLPAPGNVTPVASNLSLTANEGSAISGTLPAADANGDALTFSIVDNGAKGAAVITNPATGAFTYTPSTGETGTDTFTFKVSDGTLDSDIASVTVTLQPADRVQVTGSRGGGGSFDLSFLLLGILLLAVRHSRRLTIQLRCALSVALLAATLCVPIAQASVETEEPDRPHERTAVTVAPSGASHEAPQAVAADSTNNRSPENNLSPADWPTGLLPAVAEQWGRQTPWRPQPTRTGAQASNDRHGLTASFDAQGLRLSSAAGEIRLALAGFGRDGELQAPGAAEAEVDGARVVYRHDAHLTQWFLNSPLGLEQGFTLEQRPEGRGELRFALALGGDLQARLEQNELVFEDETGAAQLHYGALVAYDAQGQALPARMHLANARLVLAVDDADATYPVVVDPLFAQVNKITASGDGIQGERFGYSVALSGDGRTALVGAYSATPDGKINAGAAYVFTRNGPGWSEPIKLIAEDGRADDNFGWSVALWGDTALIGARHADPDGKIDAGAAYVFTRNGADWSQQAKLTADDGVALDLFGYSVALSDNTALIGAPLANPGEMRPGGGTVYFFTRSGSEWTQRDKLLAPQAADNHFGWSVALAGDTALIGAPRRYLQRGAAVVATRDDTGWRWRTILTADDGMAGDNFGWSVALSGDGATALVGALQADPDGKMDAGAAYVFTRVGADWSQQTKLTAVGGAEGDHFGNSVDLSEDGATALVGAHRGDADGKIDAGAAYAFTRVGTDWSQRTKLIVDDDGLNEFGGSVALSDDGATALVGAYRADPGGKSNAGAAYLFDSTIGLQLVKRATPEAPQGSAFVYSLYVTNHDPEVDATGVTLTDTLPPAVNYISDDSGCTWNGATVTCALDTLARDGGMANVQLTVRAAHGAPGTPVTNTASVSADQPDINPANNTDSVTTLISNTAPVASDSVLLAYEGATVAGMLSAADAGGDALTFSIVSPAAKGAVEITDASTGAYTYTAAAGQSGADAFTFKANDGIDDSNVATVSVLIQPANRAPVASNVAITTYRGTTVTGILPASDANGDPLTFAIVTNGAKGAAIITDAATGAFTYTPHAGETGADTFTFKTNDGALDSNIATVAVTIQPLPAPGNLAPIASDLSLLAYEGGVISGTLSASDANGDPLTFSIVDNGAKGAATITNTATGAFTYTPNPGKTGTDTFTFKANDGALDSNIATVAVTIQPLPAPGNLAPTASNLSLFANEGSVISGTLPAADANGDPLTFSIVDNGAKGTVVITDAATGAFTYTPNAGERGTDTFTFKVSDGALDSNIATVTVTLQPLPAPGNVAPVASSLSLLAYEGGVISGALPAADANGDPLTFSIVSNGAKGAAVITNAATGAFTYTPNAGETGTDAFTFKANDGALDSDIATVTVTLQPANRVQVTGSRGGGGSLDLWLLLLGISLLAVRICRARAS